MYTCSFRATPVSRENYTQKVLRVEKKSTAHEHGRTAQCVHVHLPDNSGVT